MEEEYGGEYDGYAYEDLVWYISKLLPTSYKPKNDRVETVTNSLEKYISSLNDFNEKQRDLFRATIKQQIYKEELDKLKDKIRRDILDSISKASDRV